MIFDEENKPIDLVYFEVKSAFERITGLKGILLLERT